MMDEHWRGCRVSVTVTHQAASPVDFGSKPLIVVTAGHGDDGAWLAAQDKLATLSTNSRHRTVASASQAIRDVSRPFAPYDRSARAEWCQRLVND